MEPHVKLLRVKCISEGLRQQLTLVILTQLLTLSVKNRRNNPNLGQFQCVLYNGLVGKLG